MSVKKEILAAKLNLDYDFDRVTDEILGCSKHWKFLPPYKHQVDDPFNKTFNVASEEDFQSINFIDGQSKALVTRQGGETYKNYIFYLREHPNTKSQSYADTKPAEHNLWQWRKDLDIPYTQQLIESFPFTTLGMIRVFIFKDTFLPVHKDWKTGGMDSSTEYDRCLGLSIIPSTGGVPMKIWSSKLDQVVEVPGNAILFNDSVWHAVPKTTGYRITIRVFGEIDYEHFAPMIDKNHVYYNK
jgi:hypothetical protein